MSSEMSELVIKLEDADHVVQSVPSDEDDVVLEKLPRPVNDLNCRMSRAYLVKLLRAANCGQNPAYGNPEKRPPFWPDYYWPWERLTDVHTKPRGMNEPLQYSEMMKLAIARGYRYYGYDPKEYVDPNVDLSEKQNPEVAPPPLPPSLPPPLNKISAPRTLLPAQNNQISLAPARRLVQGQAPPRLPRPASKLNCVQARHILSRLLRCPTATGVPELPKLRALVPAAGKQPGVRLARHQAPLVARRVHQMVRHGGPARQAAVPARSAVLRRGAETGSGAGHRVLRIRSGDLL